MTKRIFQRLEVINEFCKLSGLTLNTSKSIVTKADSLKRTDIKYAEDENFIWSSKEAKTLLIRIKNKIINVILNRKSKNSKSVFNYGNTGNSL